MGSPPLELVLMELCLKLELLIFRLLDLSRQVSSSWLRSTIRGVLDPQNVYIDPTKNVIQVLYI